MPKVSVLIPTYNSAHFLDEAIQSVLNQTFTDFELIIVDNCSTDNTQDLVLKYLKDLRIAYYKNEKNIGLVGNFNRCLELAKGEYIKFLCADDKFDSKILEKFVSVMDKSPSVSLVTSFSQGFDLNVTLWKAPFEYLQNGKKIIYGVLNDYNWLGCPSQVMLRRSNLSLGKFKDFKCITDLEMWIRHLSIGDCYIIPEPLSFGRDHAESVTRTEVEKNCSMVYEIYDLCKTIKQRNEYKLNFEELDIHSILKRRAINCALLIPHLVKTKKVNTLLLKKSLHIAFNENIFLYSLWLIAKKLISQFSPLSYNPNTDVALTDQATHKKIAKY